MKNICNLSMREYSVRNGPSRYPEEVIRLVARFGTRQIPRQLRFQPLLLDHSLKDVVDVGAVQLSRAVRRGLLRGDLKVKRFVAGRAAAGQVDGLGL